jgi:Uncharacterised protein conserved in bacteria (DUF2336)
MVILSRYSLRNECAVRPDNLVSDLEKAITNRTAEAGAILQQVTDLFLENVGHYSAEQLELYDDVLIALVDRVEVEARAKLAEQLAPIEAAPANTIQSLALDDAIEVAEPILSRSKALDDDILAYCAAVKNQEHLLAIATRYKISEQVSGQLIIKGNNKVLSVLASNAGAAISDPSFEILVKKSADDVWLSECVAGRKDIPERLLRQLLCRASEIVRHRLVAANPELNAIINEILPIEITSPINGAPAPLKDYRPAERIVETRGVSEANVNAFAREKKIDEIIVSIAQLSRLSVYEIEQLFLGRWTSPVAIILKAIGFHLRTIEAIYSSRLCDGERSKGDLVQTKAEFVALRQSTAERILRFFYAKRAVDISKH